MWGLLTGRSVLPKKLKPNHFGCLRRYSSGQIFTCLQVRAGLLRMKKVERGFSCAQLNSLPMMT